MNTLGPKFLSRDIDYDDDDDDEDDEEQSEEEDIIPRRSVNPGDRKSPLDELQVKLLDDGDEKWGIDNIVKNDDRMRTISKSFFKARPENKQLSFREQRKSIKLIRKLENLGLSQIKT